MTASLKTHLLTRKSHPIDRLVEPGPDADAIAELITIASRVPDHGKLVPWRFITYRGEARVMAGRLLATRYAAFLGRELTPGEVEKELTRFSRAPLVVGVVFVPRENPKIPQWEMLLSAGAAAMNLVHGANALGFGANWVTNWYADDEEGRAILGLMPGEMAIGFVHIGTPVGEGIERARPDLADILTDYVPPEAMA